LPLAVAQFDDKRYFGRAREILRNRTLLPNADVATAHLHYFDALVLDRGGEAEACVREATAAATLSRKLRWTSYELAATLLGGSYRLGARVAGEVRLLVWYAQHVDIKEFQQGGGFRLPISLGSEPPPGGKFYAELTGPDEAANMTLRSDSSFRLIPSTGIEYLVDGNVPKGAPCGFYRVTKLEMRCGAQVQAMEIPLGNHGFRVIPWQPYVPPAPPTVTSLG
jgi:hypothetical protein